MSIGVGVGDIVKALEIASTIRTRFVDAPEQFKAISDEVRSLSILLDDVKVVLPNRDLTSEQRKQLVGIIVGCYNILNTLNKTLEKYDELDFDTRDGRSKGFRFKMRRGWKRLRWEPEDVKELRRRITSNISLLSAFNGQLTRQVASEIQVGVDRLHERQDHRERHEEHQAIFDWLTPIDYATQQSDFISRRQEGTGQWLLNSDKFRNWVDQSNQTLFCPGIPGAGKTMSAAIIVEELYAKFQNNGNVGIAYIYCNFRRQHEQKPVDLLTSLLKQLLQGLSSVPQSVQRLYDHYQHKRTRPLLNEISQALHSIAPQYSKTFIVVDALDECQVLEGIRKQFLAELFSSQVKTAANLFITSRFIPEITKEFDESASLEIRASNDDVQRYLNDRMSRLRPFISRSLALQEEIKTKITKAVDGMFLLAQLYLDSLADKTTPKAIRLELKTFQKESEASNDNKQLKALDHAYEQAMERIEGQGAGFAELAKQALSWITCAKRPLITSELRHALAVEIGESELDEENLPEIEDILSVCAGLVTVDVESDIIRLVHYTTQEYFERTQGYWFPDAEIHIAKTCVTYLSFDVFESGFCALNEEFEARLQLNPLYDYTARHWGHHLRKAPDAQHQIPKFLGSEAQASASSQAMMASKRYEGDSDYSQRNPGRMTGVHLAAWFGLTEITSMLLQNGHLSDCKDTYGRTPLSYAAARGQEAVVRLLLARADVEADSRDDRGGTPLSRAAARGQEAVVRLLLARADIEADSRDEWGQTPLSRAAESGQEAVVRLLLARADVEADSRDDRGGTPLLWAAENGQEAVVRLLLTRADVEADSRDDTDGTPLSYAAARGHEAVVRLLQSHNSQSS